MGIEVDLLGSSESWGVEKPSTQFFQRLIKEAKLLASEICYVGDHPKTIFTQLTAPVSRRCSFAVVPGPSLFPTAPPHVALICGSMPYRNCQKPCCASMARLSPLTTPIAEIQVEILPNGR
jgi:hypothetical protein